MREADRAARWTSALVGIGIFLILAVPAYLAARAAESGSVGDLEDLDIVVPATVVATIQAVAWGYAGYRLVQATGRRPDRNPRDAWAALLAGGSVFLLGLVLLQGVLFLVAYPDENESLEERNLLIQATFIGGQFLLSAICIALATALLGRLAPSERPTGQSSEPASP